MKSGISFKALTTVGLALCVACGSDGASSGNAGVPTGSGGVDSQPVSPSASVPTAGASGSEDGGASPAGSGGAAGAADTGITTRDALKPVLLYIATSSVGKALYSWDMSDAAPVMISGALNPGFQLDSFALSPDARQVAFITHNTAAPSGEVYVLDADGSNLHRIGGAAIAGVVPRLVSWSPGGKYVSYEAEADANPQKQFAWYVLAADTGAPLAVQGILSPDDSMVATYENGVVVLEATDGSNRRELDPFNQAPTLSWSRDGRLISAWEDLHEPTVFSADGKNRWYLAYSTAPPLWAPRGEWLAFQRKNQFFVATCVTPAVPVSPVDAQVSDWLWSPDGTQFAFVTTDLQSTPVAPVKVAHVNPVLPAGSSVFAAYWSPNSQYIAYDADQIKHYEHRVFIAHPDGSDNHLVSDSAASSAYVRTIEWSPTSEYVAYVAQDSDFSKPQWYVATLGGENTFVGDGENGAWSDDGQFFALDAGKANPSVRVLRVADKRIIGPDGLLDGQHVAFALAPK